MDVRVYQRVVQIDVNRACGHGNLVSFPGDALSVTIPLPLDLCPTCTRLAEEAVHADLVARGRKVPAS